MLTREAALAEGAEGGFAGVYPVLKALEERGQVRRGYFVAGLGAAQFALPGAVDRLRAARSEPGGDGGAADGTRSTAEVVVLAATDPAQPFGAALPWPATGGRPSRSAGSRVLLADGRLLAEVDRSGRSLVLFPAADEVRGWADALAAEVRGGRYQRLEIAKVNGEPVREADGVADALRAAGFQDGYKGMVLRRR